MSAKSRGVEKLDVRRNSMILGDGKWSIILYESLIGHPDATLFLGIFQNLSFSTATRQCTH
jgi:hypothetical protein